MAPVDMGTVFDSEGLQVIEWKMLDLRKFLGLNVASSLFIRSVIYPLTVIKTRIQVNPSAPMYRGTVSTLRHIISTEGFLALYRGFIVNSFQLLSGMSYILAYERIRTIVAERGIENLHLRAFIGGGCASAVGQLILVPLDIVSQHMMVFRGKVNCGQAIRRVGPDLDPLNLRAVMQANPNVPQAVLICREIYRQDGLLRGFYRGYFASLLCYAPGSAIFWTLYQFYSSRIQRRSGGKLPLLIVNSISAPCAAVSSAILTNPLDMYRANLQIQRTGWANTFLTLWKTERWRLLSKGLSTRVLSAAVSSCLFITAYELVKRLSVHSELKEYVQW